MSRMRGGGKSNEYLWRNSLSVRGNGMWKGQEVGKSSVGSRNGKEAREARAWYVRKSGRHG